MAFLHEDFLLETPTARRLYHEVAKHQPIIDYHCHLPPREVAEDAAFPDLATVWLGGDHYKWRAMRAGGEPERLVTGADADSKEKFRAWARTVPKTLRNPLYHWTHLELKRCLGIDAILDASTADDIWERANDVLQADDVSVHAILEHFDVRVLGTTDDPVDTLEHHQRHARSGHPTAMHPTFRPDQAMHVHDPEAWNAWTDKLAIGAGETIDNARQFFDALKARHDFFHEHGCRLSDHGVDFCPFAECSDADAEAIFAKLRRGDAPNASEAERWQTRVMQEVARWNKAKGWTMQLHLGAMRGRNPRMTRQLGADAGFDCMHDEPVVRKLADFLDSLAETDEVPKTIFYHVNPTYLYPLATLMGCYQDGETAGKMQLGSGWWHVDTIDGMTRQIEALSSVGLLSQFVGMLTDSRSFLSFPRHEYFRRILCRIVGADVDGGLIPDDKELVDGLIRGICYENARDFFNFPSA